MEMVGFEARAVRGSKNRDIRVVAIREELRWCRRRRGSKA